MFMYITKWTGLLVHVHTMHTLGPSPIGRISAFSDFAATHAKQAYWYRVIPYWTSRFCTPLSKAKAKQN